MSDIVSYGDKLGNVSKTSFLDASSKRSIGISLTIIKVFDFPARSSIALMESWNLDPDLELPERSRTNTKFSEITSLLAFKNGSVIEEQINRIINN